MYNTSDAYKAAINASVVRNRVDGKITLKDGTELNIRDGEIIPGSLSINNKCINSSNFCFGSVYVGEMNISLKKEIDRYSLYGARVELSYYLTLPDKTEEKIPLGVFYVDSPKRTKKIVALKCYDRMTDFDIDVTEETVGTAFQLLSFICEYCGVELANTEEEITAMCNGSQLYSIYADRVGTYRDAISYIASVLAGYATINREGKLQIRSFQTTSCMDITAKRRTVSTIADYETFFYAVKARFVSQQNFYPYTEIDDTVEGGLLLDMGDIPIVQGMEETKHEILQSILAVLKNIRYTPSEFSMLGNPSIDLGDTLCLKDVNFTTDSVNTLVTSFTWNYHKAEKIKSDGANTKLQGVSSSEDKQLTDLGLRVDSKKLVVHTFTNSSKIEVGDTAEKPLIVINYATVEDTKPIFMATIPLEMTLDGYIEFFVYIDGILDENGVITEYFEKGKHFVTISRYFIDKANKRHTVTVAAKTVYVESDNRVTQANVATIFNYITAAQADRENQSSSESGAVQQPIQYDVVPVNTTPPAATIQKNDIRAVLYAQGLAGTSKWDGTLNIEEPIEVIPINTIGVSGIIENVIAGVEIPTAATFTEVIGAIPINTVQISGIEISGGVNEVVTNYTFNTDKKNLYSYDADYVNADGKFMLNQEIETVTSQTIITNAISLTHESITGIENMTATCEGDLIVAVSFDGKKTWKAWNGSEWSTLSDEYSGMNKATLEAITFEQWNILYQGATAFYIRVALTDVTQSVTEIYVDFAN